MVGLNGTGQPETEKVNTHIVTLTRFLTEEQVKHKEATGDFTYGTPFYLQACAAAG
jgi:fructose-1,6-bisphosphatase I